MKGFAILWAAIWALLIIFFREEYVNGTGVLRSEIMGALSLESAITIMIFSAVISTLLSVSMFLLWMGIRYLASKWSGS